VTFLGSKIISNILFSNAQNVFYSLIVVPLRAMGYEKVDEWLHSFLALGLDGVSGQLQSPATLPPGSATGTHRLGSWMGPRVGPDVV